jgi:hypothetical protein
LRQLGDVQQIDDGNVVIIRACIVRVQIAAAAAIWALILSTAATGAQAIHVPNSEMPGRERERFVDPPAPKSQPGNWLTAPINQVPPAPKRRPKRTAQPKR